MDGIHDMGGMHGFGPVDRHNDYTFRAEWQRKAFGIVEALAGVVPFNADTHRQALERISADEYLRHTYFELWVMATETLLLEAGLVNESELKTGKKEFDVDLASRPAVGPKALVAAFIAGVPLEFPFDSEPSKFKEGEKVRVTVNAPRHHTRVPRYIRGRIGTIVKDSGVFQFADAVATGKGQCPQHCYAVAFSAEDLWGKSAESRETVYADLWESYLEQL
jgi:nitrile hydratase subunit beta